MVYTPACDMRMSPGALIKIERRVSAMLASPIEELRVHLQGAASAHGDETSGGNG
ncbi:MAG: hypothetical protein U0470_05520 [Anaerolineae bacterium]